MCWGLIWRCSKRVFKMDKNQDTLINFMSLNRFTAWAEIHINLSIMACKMRKSISKMNSRQKVLLTGVIYFLLLGIGTVGFQRIEEGAMLERCARLVCSWVKTLYYCKLFRAKEKAKKFKDDLVSKSFYRFDYHEKVCENLGKVFNEVKRSYKQPNLKWVSGTTRNQLRLALREFISWSTTTKLLHQKMWDANRSIKRGQYWIQKSIRSRLQQGCHRQSCWAVSTRND